MKNQALFSSKDKSKKLKYRLRQFLYGALRINFEKFHYAKARFFLHFFFFFYIHTYSILPSYSDSYFRFSISSQQK